MCSIVPFGQIRKDKVWNCYFGYLDGYSKSYCSFYDFGKTVFLLEEDANEKLVALNKEKNEKSLETEKELAYDKISEFLYELDTIIEELDSRIITNNSIRFHSQGWDDLFDKGKQLFDLIKK